MKHLWALTVDIAPSRLYLRRHVPPSQLIMLRLKWHLSGVTSLIATVVVTYIGPEARQCQQDKACRAGLGARLNLAACAVFHRHTTASFPTACETGMIRYCSPVASQKARSRRPVGLRLLGWAHAMLQSFPRGTLKARHDRADS